MPDTDAYSVTVSRDTDLVLDLSAVDSVLLGFHEESDDPLFAWNMVSSENQELTESVQVRKGG